MKGPFPAGLNPASQRYLENGDAEDPLNRLAVGATDQVGAEHRAPLRQNTYDSYVVELQHDLRLFGLRAKLEWGVFDAATENLVIRFQQTAKRSRRGGTKDPVPITFVGEATGVVDGATRAEIALWKRNGWFVRTLQVSDAAAEAIFAFTARRETGRAVEDRRRTVRHPSGFTTDDTDPGAYASLAVDRAEGLRVGLLGFSERSGWLGRLLRKVYAADPPLLEEALGPGYRDLYNATRPTPVRRLAKSLQPDARWEWFVRHPAIRKVQLQLAWDGLLRPVQEAAARNRIRTVKGLALLVDIAYTIDVETAEIVADACGPRPPRMPVAEHLAVGLYVLERMSPPGAAARLRRCRDLVNDPSLDEVEEYAWDVQIRLHEPFASPERV